jgi:hypothetical protein
LYTGIYIAIITGVFSILVTLLQKGRKENKLDHNLVYDSIQELKSDVKDVGSKLDNHIDWHLKK